MSLARIAKQLVAALQQQQQKLVFAESCTGGLACATLAAIPGVSANLCGSLVVYRNETKIAFLQIAPEIIAQHTAVSKEVALCMAQAALERTPEADLAAAVTGHLGPQAPTGFDGLVFFGLAWRKDGETCVAVERFQCPENTKRAARQKLVTEALLSWVLQWLQEVKPVAGKKPGGTK